MSYQEQRKFIMDCAQTEPTDKFKFTLWQVDKSRFLKYESDSRVMAGMHAALLRGLESIEKQLDTDHSSDHVNWIGYCRSFTNILLGHHLGEEEALFPALEKQLGPQIHNIDQHHALIPAVEEFDKYLESCIADYTKWNTSIVRDLIEKFKEPMMVHLTDELKGLDPALLKEKCTESFLEEADKIHMAYIQKHADPFLNLVYIVTHNGPKDHDWPRLPFVPGRILIPYVFRWRHNGYWKYAPHPINEASKLIE